jgi:hypothetical protein
VKQLRPIIWLECGISMLVVIVAISDVNQYDHPALDIVFGNPLGQLSLLALLLLGLTIPLVVVVEGARKAVPPQTWIVEFVLTLPLAVLQLFAFRLLVM